MNKLKTEDGRWRRLSRPCFDKYRRCPGWAGSAWKYAKVHRCDNGFIQIDWEDKLWKWKFWPCNTCNVLVLPYVAHWLFPSYIAWNIKRAWDNKIESIQWKLENRKRRRHWDTKSPVHTRRKDERGAD